MGTRPTVILATLFATLILVSCATTAPVVTSVPPERQVLPGYIRGSKDVRAKRVIVFIHGVFGDGTSTWTNPSNRAYFPRLVADDPTFAGVDVWVHEFESPTLRRGHTIDELADDLRKWLNNDNVIANHDEVVFVCHSMGGLVARAYLLKYRVPASQVRMLYFFSTPTTGADVATLARLVSANPQLTDMRKMATDAVGTLGTWQAQWVASEYNQATRSFCAYELLPTFGMQIVQRESATNLCNTRYDPLRRDHLAIVKPADDRDDSYIAFREAYRETFPNATVLTPPTPPTAPATKPADDNAPLTTGRDAQIDSIIEQMDVRSLLGQVLMVGFAAGKDHQDANQRLASLVQDYSLGAVILYYFNFPNELTAASGETARHIAGLTANLQRAVYESQPPDRKIPLLIAIDQEGGRDVHIKRDITRMPNQIHLGVTRNPVLAERVGTAVGTELAALGINVNLAPVADINTKHVTDLIGRRAFSSRPDVAAALAVAFTRGLQASGILAIAKHYPGHGNAATDPHRAMTSMEYQTKDELEENDAIPFKAVAHAGADGIMTSHMLTPLDNNLPATISPSAIRYLREDLKYDGLVVTDDIVDMMGILMDKSGKIIRDRASVARDALRAGHDLILFGCVSRYELPQDPKRTITREEFAAIHATLLRHFETHPEDRALLRASVRRVLRAKARLAPLNTAITDWMKPFDDTAFRSLLQQHDELARNVASASAVLITEQGRVIADQEQAAHFRQGYGPLHSGALWREGDRIVLVSPTTIPQDELYDALTARWIPKDQFIYIPLIHGWRDDYERRILARLWGRVIPEYSHTSSITGKTTYHYDEAIDPEVDRIVARARDARLVIFGAFKHEHLRILNRVCDKLTTPAQEIIVLLFKEEPYFLVERLYAQRNVTILYVSPWPTTALAADILFGNLRPRPASALPVPVTGIVDRPVGLPHHAQE